MWCVKYCVHCGAEIHEEAVICVKCGCNVEPNNPALVQQVQSKDDTLSIVIKVFLILGCISQGWLLIPLIWCIPMTVSIFHSLRDNRPIGMGMKICTLIFVNLIAGVCLLCMNDEI